MCSDASSKFCCDKLGTFVRRFHEQVDGQTVKLRALDTKVAEHDASLNALREQIQELRGALALAN
eukprot:2776432-Pyramimonas_sp.AAC.1